MNVVLRFGSMTDCRCEGVNSDVPSWPRLGVGCGFEGDDVIPSSVGIPTSVGWFFRLSTPEPPAVILVSISSGTRIAEFTEVVVGRLGAVPVSSGD